jgi:pimeloyl-ACP methyl ester carboxylesterase
MAEVGMTHPPRDFTLPTGQRVSWREYGVTTGKPIFFNNGWPGCSEQAVYLHELAVRHGLRIISPDRPGFGRATSQPGRGLLDWPPLIAAIADHLDIDRFSILGISGGGPYSLATAWALGSRVQAVCICCGAVPTHTSEARQGLLRAYRFMLALNDIAPWSLPGLLRAAAMTARLPLPHPLLKLLFPLLLPKPDSQALSNRHIFELFLPSYQGAVRAGGGALYEDAHPYTQPWPFAVEEITTPVRMWHGTQDANFHITQARLLADRLPNVAFHERNEGHYSLPFNCAEEMVLDLLASSAE